MGTHFTRKAVGKETSFSAFLTGFHRFSDAFEQSFSVPSSLFETSLFDVFAVFRRQELVGLDGWALQGPTSSREVERDRSSIPTTHSSLKGRLRRPCPSETPINGPNGP